MTWIGVSLLATAASAIEAHSVKRAALMTLAAVTLLLAHATKETSLVLVAVSLGWLAIERGSARPRPPGRASRRPTRGQPGRGGDIPALRWYYAPSGSRRNLHAGLPRSTRERSAAPRFDHRLARPGFRVPPATRCARRSLSLRRPAGRDRTLLYACVWMAGWLAVYLPWPATFAYYLLPFTFGPAVLAGIVVGDAVRLLGAEHPVSIRRTAWSVLVASGVLWCGDGQRGRGCAHPAGRGPRERRRGRFPGDLPSRSRVS